MVVVLPLICPDAAWPLNLLEFTFTDFYPISVAAGGGKMTQTIQKAGNNPAGKPTGLTLKCLSESLDNNKESKMSNMMRTSGYKLDRVTLESCAALKVALDLQSFQLAGHQQQKADNAQNLQVA